MELLVVVATLGILAAIAIPHYRQYIAKAQRVEAISTLDYIAKAEMSYFSAHDYFLTNNLGLDSNDINEALGLGRIWVTPSGWNFDEYWGWSGNQSYWVTLSKQFDSDPSLDTWTIQYNFPFFPHCSDGKPYITYDDLLDQFSPCI